MKHTTRPNPQNRRAPAPSPAGGHIAAPIIPTTPEIEAAIVGVYAASGKPNARPDTTQTRLLPIVGWRQFYDGHNLTVLPVVPGEWDDAAIARMAIVLLDGTYFLPGFGFYASDEFCALRLKNE